MRHTISPIIYIIMSGDVQKINTIVNSSGNYAEPYISK